MGGPRITPEVENLVVETWLDMKQKKSEPTAKEVNNAVKQKLTEIGKTNLHVPEVRKTQDILRQARQNLEQRSLGREELDGPWTIGSTAKHRIEAEAMPSVIRVWKLCVASDVPFSIREAKWVAQLHAVILDPIELKEAAYKYALREKVFEAAESSEAFDTYGLDSRITMEIWEYATARRLGKMKSSSWFLENLITRPESLQIPTGEGQKAMEFASRAAGLRRVIEGNLIPELSSVDGLTKLRERALNSPELDLPEEAAWVFAHWLTYLSKGPKWLELSLNEILDIEVKLREWVLASVPKNLTAPETLLNAMINSESLTQHPKGDLTDYLIDPEQRPAELLKQVGYD